ncbi:MAG: YidH family protein [Candidatus Kariarchaeaceae archaeon]|jgi:putative membrane protein
MRPNPYSKYKSENLILRDELAIDRTVLANERTVLAYIRTAFAFVVAGITIIEVLETQLYQFIGFFFILLGILNASWGTYRFLVIRRRLRFLG